MTTDVTDTIEIKGVSDKILSKYGAVNKAINRRLKHNRSKKVILEEICEADRLGKPVPKKPKNL